MSITAEKQSLTSEMQHLLDVFAIYRDDVDEDEEVEAPDLTPTQYAAMTAILLDGHELDGPAMVEEVLERIPAIMEKGYDPMQLASFLAESDPIEASAESKKAADQRARIAEDRAKENELAEWRREQCEAYDRGELEQWQIEILDSISPTWNSPEARRGYGMPQ